MKKQLRFGRIFIEIKTAKTLELRRCEIIKTHEFTDVTIKALDADGKVVTNYGQNNDGDIMMYLEEYGNKQESPDFILP